MDDYPRLVQSVCAWALISLCAVGAACWIEVVRWIVTG